MIILGIDPGTRVTGYGLIRCVGGKIEPLDYGCIRPPTDAHDGKRYGIIFEAVEALIKAHNPKAIAVESQFVHRNVKSAMKLAMARAMVLLAAERAELEAHEIPPSKAKQAVVGNGQASKQQVQRMIQTLLNLPEIPEPEDAADALALAFCLANRIGLAHA